MSGRVSSFVLTSALTLTILMLEAHSAAAACPTSGTAKAYGDWWVERSGTYCDCVFKAQKYTCVASSGVHDAVGSPETLETLTGSSEDCDRACEDIAGYWTKVSGVKTRYLATSGAYECDSTFTDADGDGAGYCLDANDTDPRVWINTGTSETACDGVDNDADGTVDDGFSPACDNDHKRLRQANLFQGNGLGMVNLVEGSLLRSEVDATIAAPYGPIVFQRHYNSKRTSTGDAGLGVGWTHSFAVWFKIMPTGDNRYQVQGPTGEMSYFRCWTLANGDSTCAIDDHRPQGNLRYYDPAGGSSKAFYWMPGNGSTYKFSNTAAGGRYPYTEHRDSAGFLLSKATADATTGHITKVESANSNIFFALGYDSYNHLSTIGVNDTSSSKRILEYTVTSTTHMLIKVKFASSVGTIDNDTYLGYSYHTTTPRRLERIEQLLERVDQSDHVATTGYFAYATSGASQGRVTLIQDATKDLTIAWNLDTMKTTVTYNVESSGNSSTEFTHNGMWVLSRNSAFHIGGMAAKAQEYDIHGRVTCELNDDSTRITYTFSDHKLVTSSSHYDNSGSSCASAGSLKRQFWHSYEFNAARMSWRPKWTRHKSVYQPSYYSSTTDCSSGSTPPNGCVENNFWYVSATDDRVRTSTTTGYTWVFTSQNNPTRQYRAHRTYFHGLDSVCDTSNAYPGLPCRVEIQDDSETPFTRNDYLYIASGTSAGLPYKVERYKNSSTKLTITYGYPSDSNATFGSPTSITDEAGVVGTYTYNGWNAVTQVVEADALLDDALSPSADDITTSYAYNYFRQLSTTTLPKGNKLVKKYGYVAGTFGRLKADATADASGNPLEIRRYLYDGVGNVKETRILDSINGTTPCEHEDCAASSATARYQRKFNANGQAIEDYINTSQLGDAPADGTLSRTFDSTGRLTQTSDFLTIKRDVDYDSEGRLYRTIADTGRTSGQPSGVNAIAAKTQLEYDNQSQLATTKSPMRSTSVDTTTEHDDFGRNVTESSNTRGTTRFEYDTRGSATRRRRPGSVSGTEDTCYTVDWLGRTLTVDHGCDEGTPEWTLSYDGDNEPSGACPSAAKPGGRLSKMVSSTMTRVICYHPNGRTYGAYQTVSGSWSSLARGTDLIYDLNGNLAKVFANVKANSRSRSDARVIEYVYDGTLKDRVSYVRHKLDGAGSWTLVTSNSTLPTYFPFGGFKTLTYANGIVEENTQDYSERLTERKTSYSSTTFTKIDLTYDNNGNITTYDDSTGLRHLAYHAAVDNLNRLRCLSRASVGTNTCVGTSTGAFDAKFLEAFDYDASGNRVKRRWGPFGDTDLDKYVYVSGPTDIIDKVTSAGTDKQMSHTPRGEIKEVNQPVAVSYGHDIESRITSVTDQYLGNTYHYYSLVGDRYRKDVYCNSRWNTYLYNPDGPGGASPEAFFLNLYNKCEAEYPRLYRSVIYLEGRPIAFADADLSSTSTITEGATHWIHSDHLGTPVLVTNSVRTERWRWENDPFGRADPIEYAVSSQTLSPSDTPTSSGKYNTCCCSSCSPSVPPCNTSQNSCTSGCCASGASQDVVWSKTYPPTSITGINNLRVHFSTFDVKAGSTRTGNDYVRLLKNGSTSIGDFTGNLGDHWSPWAGVDATSLKVELYSDNSQDNTVGFTIDKFEYTTTTNGQFVVQLRMPGQMWDDESRATYNFHRWYRREDGRYLSPDPIGLEGDEAGYFAYVNSNPLVATDPSGLADCPRAGSMAPASCGTDGSWNYCVNLGNCTASTLCFCARIYCSDPVYQTEACLSQIVLGQMRTRRLDPPNSGSPNPTPSAGVPRCDQLRDDCYQCCAPRRNRFQAALNQWWADSCDRQCTTLHGKCKKGDCSPAGTNCTGESKNSWVEQDRSRDSHRGDYQWSTPPGLTFFCWR